MISFVWSKAEQVVVSKRVGPSVPTHFYNEYRTDDTVNLYRQLDSIRIWQKWDRFGKTWLQVKEDNVPSIIRMQAMLLR